MYMIVHVHVRVTVISRPCTCTHVYTVPYQGVIQGGKGEYLPL